MESILVSLITGGLSLLGVVITTLSGNRKLGSRLERHQAVTDTKLDELTREVREHNGFARRMPVLEQQLQDVLRRLKLLEERN